MRCLDSLILEAASLFMAPHQTSAFRFPRLASTDDATALSQLLFGHRPHTNAEDVIATALDMRGWKMPPASTVVQAYIAAAVNQWVFQANITHGWISTHYRARKMEGFISRGQSLSRSSIHCEEFDMLI
jgi:hypothetical protein